MHLHDHPNTTRPRARRLRALGAVVSLSVLASGVAATASSAATKPKAKKPSTASIGITSAQQSRLKGVSLNVGTFLYDGWEGELQAAGLANTPYHIAWDGLNSGFLQIAAIEAGSIDAGDSSFIPPIFTASSPAASSLKIVADSLGNTEEQDVIVPGSSTDSSVQSLVGQTVGYVSNVTDEYFLAQALKNANIPWSSIKSVAFTTPANGLAALEGGSIQALATYGTTIATAQESIGAKVLINGGPLLSASSGNKGLLGFAEASTADLANPQKEAAIADLIARVDTSEAWARTHPSIWSTIVSAATQNTTTYEQEYKLFVNGERQVETQVGPVNVSAEKGEIEAAGVLEGDSLIPSNSNPKPLFSTSLNKLVNADIAYYQKKFPQYNWPKS
jgi:sulfonate transport system substrate-binding protein